MITDKEKQNLKQMILKRGNGVSMNQIMKEIDRLFESKINILAKIITIASEKMLRIERWRDSYQSWRIGIEWYSENDYEFVVEDKSIDEALSKACKHLMDEKKKN